MSITYSKTPSDAILILLVIFFYLAYIIISGYNKIGKEFSHSLMLSEIQKSASMGGKIFNRLNNVKT